jgi:hypothetical protein
VHSSHRDKQALRSAAQQTLGDTSFEVDRESKSSNNSNTELLALEANANRRVHVTPARAGIGLAESATKTLIPFEELKDRKLVSISQMHPHTSHQLRLTKS